MIKGIGIPAPSGENPVGCVDLMHQVYTYVFTNPFSASVSQFEGDDRGGLLVRLFYPAQLNSSQPRNLPSTYTPWAPHKRYDNPV